MPVDPADVDLRVRPVTEDTDTGHELEGGTVAGTGLVWLGQQGEAQARAYARGMAGDNGST